MGTIVWLGSEVMFFAGLFAIYFTLRSTSPELWESRVPLLDLPFAAVNTTILVLSSVTAQFGVFAAERLQARATGWKPTQWGMIEWFFLTYVMGAIFVAGQVYEYAVLVSEGLTLASDAYGSAFFLTTGFHGLHVATGIGLMGLMLVKSFIPGNYVGGEQGVEATSLFWHFVDVMWIILFLLIYVWQ